MVDDDNPPSGLGEESPRWTVRPARAAAPSSRVDGEVFGTHRTHPRDAVIAVRELSAGCPPRGQLAVIKTSDAMWDVGLSIGGDRERCYLQERERTTQRNPAKVFELPVTQHGSMRAHLERRWSTRTWIPKRPPNWVPTVGADVAVTVAGSLQPARILVQRPGAVRLARSGAYQWETIDDWRSLRNVVPLPAADARATGEVICMSDDDKRCIERVPAETVELLVVSLRDADLFGRTMLIKDLMLDLEAIHTRRTNGLLEWVRIDNTPVAQARYAIAIKDDGEGFYSMGWVLETREPTLKRPPGYSGLERIISREQILDMIEQLDHTATAFMVDNNSEMLLLYDVRVVTKDRPETLAGASARLLSELGH